MWRVALMLTCLSGLLGACGSADDSALAAGGFAYENPIFRSTGYIEAKAQAGKTAGEPRFSWLATHAKHVVCGVFDERISIKDQTITNTHRLRWMWHTGLADGREGNVLFEHGTSDPETGAAPVPLVNGRYYWAVWAMDVTGIPSLSSPEYTLDIPIAP
jgi:hypothetical protein